jgi:hypothetical protein
MPTSSQRRHQRRAYELDCKIHDSAGLMVLNRLHSRSFTLNIFSTNANELNDALQLVSTPQVAIQLMAVKNRDAGTQAHREVIRLFHNFLAGAMTLVDQTRVFIREHYKGTSLDERYSAEVKIRFSDSQLHAFIQGLRNFMLHKGLPNSEQHITFTKGKDFECGIRFSREELEDFSGWKAGAREFLLTQPDKIVLLNVCSQYEEMILAFHNWLDLAIREHHHAELAELERLQTQYEEQYGRDDPPLTLDPNKYAKEHDNAG